MPTAAKLAEVSRAGKSQELVVRPDWITEFYRV